MNVELTDDIILARGYKEYKPTAFHSEGIIKCFQKRFDDDKGKKYFIDINKWSWDDIASVAHKMDPCYKSYTYEFETQLYKKGTHDAVDMIFHNSWKIEQVEEFVEIMFQMGMLDYYEKWEEE
jgi:hypothetical protein